MWVSCLVVWVVVYAVLGWMYESTYCTIVERKWENRGFLYGPLCPIYGVGAVAMLLAWNAVITHGIRPAAWQVFVVSALGSALLEYATSWVLEKKFHARWWDYSNMPLNLNGRICLPATTLFGLAGLLVAYVLYQPTLQLTDSTPPIALETLSLVLMCIITVDTTLTVSALTRFAQHAEAVSEAINNRMDKLVSEAVDRSEVAAGSLEQERERVAAQIRASRVGEMGHDVRLAVRRVRSFTASEAEADAVRQLESLRKAVHKVMEKE